MSSPLLSTDGSVNGDGTTFPSILGLYLHCSNRDDPPIAEDDGFFDFESEATASVTSGGFRLPGTPLQGGHARAPVWPQLPVLHFAQVHQAEELRQRP